MWEVDYGYIEAWLDEQDKETVSNVFAALELLEREGPGLGRPLVDSLRKTKYANLKELRPASPGPSEVRIIFAFDPRRRAVMLLAGDKSSGQRSRLRWSGWYRLAIPQAERIYEEHLKRLEANHGKS